MIPDMAKPPAGGMAEGSHTRLCTADSTSTLPRVNVCTALWLRVSLPVRVNLLDRRIGRVEVLTGRWSR